jgi:hypothetical protein
MSLYSNASARNQHCALQFPATPTDHSRRMLAKRLAKKEKSMIFHALSVANILYIAFVISARHSLCGGFNGSRRLNKIVGAGVMQKKSDSDHQASACTPLESECDFAPASSRIDLI